MILGERILTKEREPDPKTAWIFPGQGTQEVGMGSELWGRYPIVRQIYRRADEILGDPISRYSFEGPEEELRKTAKAQPATYVYQQACLAVLEAEGLPGFEQPPAFVAGHSLGQYSALVAAGALDFENGLRLVQERGRLTQQAAETNPGGMLAVIAPAVKEIAMQLVKGFNLEVCVINTDEQIVVGGPLEALKKAQDRLSQLRVWAKPLNIAGAFHTSLMNSAKERFAQIVASTEIKDSQIPIIANTTGEIIQKAQELKDELVNQFTNPVLWSETISQLLRQGVERIVEIGETGILSKINKRIAGGVVIGTVATLTGVAAAVLWHRYHQQPPTLESHSNLR